MENLINSLVPMLGDILKVLGAVVLLATAIVRLTPSKDDDKYVDNFSTWFFKIMAWLPTIGVNPQTKKLQEAYEELKAKDVNKTAS